MHEATLEDGLEADAHSKGHSTTSEAVASGLGYVNRMRWEGGWRAPSKGRDGEGGVYIRGLLVVWARSHIFDSMGAKWILLTHFSQRYPKIPVLDTMAENKVGVAFDLMHVRYTFPLLSCLFSFSSRHTN